MEAFEHADIPVRSCEKSTPLANSEQTNLPVRNSANSSQSVASEQTSMSIKRTEKSVTADELFKLVTKMRQEHESNNERMKKELNAQNEKIKGLQELLKTRKRNTVSPIPVTSNRSEDEEVEEDEADEEADNSMIISIKSEEESENAFGDAGIENLYDA